MNRHFSRYDDSLGETPGEVNREVQREQQGEDAAERKHLAYERLGEEGGEAVKEKYIDSWRNDDNSGNADH